ncbi:MAG TPA: DinB family protein [Puia sp.]|nr:DinB family protein [Puia sp.]
MPLSASILARLQHQHETISELIEGVDEKRLKQRPNPDKWSPFENIAHLASYQPTFINRIKLMLEGNTQGFNRYVAENDPLFHEYLQKSLTELLDDISEKRSIIINELKGFKEEQLSTRVIHPKFGNMTVSQWTDFFLLHEAHHLYTIFQLLGTFR